MSGIRGRQKRLIDRLLARGFSGEPSSDAGFDHYAQHLFSLRKSKLLRSLPRTATLLGSIFDRLFDDFARRYPPRSRLLNGDVPGFVRFSCLRLKADHTIPVHVIDLMKFEAAISRARAADGFEANSMKNDIGVELVVQNFDLAPLFESPKSPEVLIKRKCRLVLWIDRASGKLRVVEIRAKSFALLRRMRRSGADGKDILSSLGIASDQINGDGAE